MKIKTFFPALIFSSDLSNIEITDVQSELKFILKCRSENGFSTIFSETYTPDTSGKIRIYNLHKIYEYHLEEYPVNDFQFEFISTSDNPIYKSRILKSNAEIHLGTVAFVSNHFLTLLSQKKRTYPESLEYLSTYSLEPEPIKVVAKYRNQAGNYSTNEYSEGITKKEDITLLNVSPSKYLIDDLTLVRYTVSCGSRLMQYDIDNVNDKVLEVSFLNNFGVIETFATYSTVSSESKFEKKFGSIHGIYTKLTSDKTKEYTANTGIIDEATADWLEMDLFSSYYVFEIRSGAEWKRITITDETVKRNSNKDSQPNFEFKYRYSQRIHDIAVFKQNMNRIFNQMFDIRFN